LNRLITFPRREMSRQRLPSCFMLVNPLGALKQKFGFTYAGTKPDGSKVAYTEGQLVGEVLQYLRGQVQLVIGYAVAPDDLLKFLKARNVSS